MQRVAHLLSDIGQRIVVEVIDVDATDPVDEVCNRRLSRNTQQSKIIQAERAGITR